ncbi:uncharacterized protein LOC135153437 [Lytechinus pictus]|uniref:uncharacterized protein LOC135153437 n=1 Tax=Lytechinus pictus TaxID=7653 RepID=UPI0030B9B442
MMFFFFLLCLLQDIAAFLNFRRGEFFSVRGGVLDMLKQKLSIGVDSKIFPIAKPFMVEDKIIEGFDSPPFMRMSEVKSSPRKRRVSVKGVVVQVGEVKRYKETKVRKIDVQDDGGGLIEVSMWGSSVDIDVSKASKLIFRNVQIGNSTWCASVESTASMTVECVDEDKTVLGDVVCVGSSG